MSSQNPSGLDSTHVLRTMFQKAQALFDRYYIIEPRNDDPQPQPPSAFRLLWLLYATAQRMLLPQKPDLLHGHALLLACLDAFLASTPPSSPCLRHRFDDFAHFPVRTESGAAATLRCLLASAPAGKDVGMAACKFVQALDAVLADILAPAGLAPASIDEVYNHSRNKKKLLPHQLPSPSCRAYIGLLQNDGSVDASIMQAVESYYETQLERIALASASAHTSSHVSSVGAFDERALLLEYRWCTPTAKLTQKTALGESSALPRAMTGPRNSPVPSTSQQQQQQHPFLANSQAAPSNINAQDKRTQKPSQQQQQQRTPPPPLFSGAMCPTNSDGTTPSVSPHSTPIADMLQAVSWLEDLSGIADTQNGSEGGLVAAALNGLTEARRAESVAAHASRLASAVWKQDGHNGENADAPADVVDGVARAAGPEAPQLQQQQQESLSGKENTASLPSARDARARSGAPLYQDEDDNRPAAVVTALPRQHTLALFALALRGLLLAEHNTDPGSIDRLLRCEALLRGVMACAAECVAAAYRHPELAFPTVLKMLDVAPFDVYKLIAAFVRSVPGMPKATMRHLVSIEERMLEHLVWQQGSSLYAVLMMEATGADDVGKMVHTHLATSLHACKGECPDGVAGSGRGGTYAANTTRSAAGNAAAFTMLSGVLAKCLRLAALRLSDLLQRLDLTGSTASSHTLYMQAYTVVAVAVQQHTWLLYGRHLDHIVLCALYSICKANQARNAMFKAILEGYRMQAQANEDTIRNVSMAVPPFDVHGRGRLLPLASSVLPKPDGHAAAHTRHSVGASTSHASVVPTSIDVAATDDIIAFYNRIFLAELGDVVHGVVSGNVTLVRPMPLAPVPLLRRSEPPRSSGARGAVGSQPAAGDRDGDGRALRKDSRGMVGNVTDETPNSKQAPPHPHTNPASHDQAGAAEDDLVTPFIASSRPIGAGAGPSTGKLSVMNIVENNTINSDCDTNHGSSSSTMKHLQRRLENASTNMEACLPSSQQQQQQQQHASPSRASFKLLPGRWKVAPAGAIQVPSLAFAGATPTPCGSQFEASQPSQPPQPSTTSLVQRQRPPRLSLGSTSVSPPRTGMPHQGAVRQYGWDHRSSAYTAPPSVLLTNRINDAHVRKKRATMAENSPQRGNIPNRMEDSRWPAPGLEGESGGLRTEGDPSLQRHQHGVEPPHDDAGAHKGRVVGGEREMALDASLDEPLWIANDDEMVAVDALLAARGGALGGLGGAEQDGGR